MSKKHLGSSVDDFLKKENIFEEAQAQAIKEVVAWQLAKAMKKRKQPLPGRPHSRPEARHHAVEPAAGSGAGWTSGDDRIGLSVSAGPCPQFGDWSVC